MPEPIALVKTEHSVLALMPSLEWTSEAADAAEAANRLVPASSYATSEGDPASVQAKKLATLLRGHYQILQPARAEAGDAVA